MNLEKAPSPAKHFVQCELDIQHILQQYNNDYIVKELKVAIVKKIIVQQKIITQLISFYQVSTSHTTQMCANNQDGS